MSALAARASGAAQYNNGTGRGTPDVPVGDETGAGAPAGGVRGVGLTIDTSGSGSTGGFAGVPVFVGAGMISILCGSLHGRRWR